MRQARRITPAPTPTPTPMASVVLGSLAGGLVVAVDDGLSGVDDDDDDDDGDDSAASVVEDAVDTAKAKDEEMENVVESVVDVDISVDISSEDVGVLASTVVVGATPAVAVMVGSSIVNFRNDAREQQSSAEQQYLFEPFPHRITHSPPLTLSMHCLLVAWSGKQPCRQLITHTKSRTKKYCTYQQHNDPGIPAKPTSYPYKSLE